MPTTPTLEVAQPTEYVAASTFKFGFAAGLTRALDLPGPVDRARFLALELEAGALQQARGPVRATGTKAATLRAKLSQGRRAA